MKFYSNWRRVIGIADIGLSNSKTGFDLYELLAKMTGIPAKFVPKAFRMTRQMRLKVSTKPIPQSAT